MRWPADGGRPLLAPLLLLLVSWCGDPVHAETDVVRLLNSYEQIITSSILRWVSVEPGQPIPENAVIGALSRTQPSDSAAEEKLPEEDKSYVCRLKLEGMWVSGQVRPAESPNCVASMHGQITKSEAFEVLENTDNGARLSWARWDKYSRIPAGTITGDGINYVARRNSSGYDDKYNYQLGRLKPEGLGKLTVITGENTAEDFEDGQVLVETEPISYEMTKIKFNMWRKRITQQEMTLGEKQLANWDSEGEPSHVDAAISYKYNYSMSWGYGQAIITGLPVSVRLLNNTALDDFKWGIDVTSERQELYSVDALLAPGTAVNVTLIGNYTDAMIPYGGQVTAVYADGEKRSRPLTGSRREVAMRAVRPVYGQVYFMNNGSFVPTTTTTSTSTSTTSTSTTSRTTSSKGTTEQPSPIPVPPGAIEKAVDPNTGKKLPADQLADKTVVKGENSAMQNDESSVRTAESSRAARGAQYLPLLVLPLVTVLRVT